MHQALRDVLGSHVEQKGSLQNADITRFDISHPQGITAEEIAEVERRVNHAIIVGLDGTPDALGYAETLGTVRNTASQPATLSMPWAIWRARFLVLPCWE